MVRELDRRWLALRKLVGEAIVERDAFGMRVITGASVAMSSMSGGRAMAFQRWFDEALNATVLGFDRTWVDRYVGVAYRRSYERASRQTKVRPPPPGDRDDLLVKLTITELQGVMEAVSQQAVRAMGNALLKRADPARAARIIRQVIAKIGVTRGRATAQGMIVRAAAEASLDAFQSAGVTRVGILPETIPSPARREPLRDADEELVEVLTAGDDLVCEECEDISNDGPYDIDDARGLIPAHPHCRCAFVPLDDARFAEVERSEDSVPMFVDAGDQPRVPAGSPDGGQFAGGQGGGGDGPADVAALKEGKYSGKDAPERMASKDGMESDVMTVTSDDVIDDVVGYFEATGLRLSAGTRLRIKDELVLSPSAGEIDDGLLCEVSVQTQKFAIGDEGIRLRAGTELEFVSQTDDGKWKVVAR